jgi:formimidoylglutamate deiminase
MYAVAAVLSPEQLEDVSAFAFLEMARAGITSVGEFHYLYRDPAGQPYDDPNELPHRVIRAAQRVGIKIVLLRTAYARGGPGRALEGAQRRFDLGDLDSFLSATEALAQSLTTSPNVSVGLAPHSVRAVSPEQLRGLGAAAASRTWPVHMHLSEQPREIEACLAETKRRPVELASDYGLLTPRFSAVHAIHLSEVEIGLLGRARATVVACPTTERDLGDGIVPADALRAAGVSLALGTDSQTQIDLLEDARALELDLRLQRQKRLLVDATPDQRHALAGTLLAAATAGGARALGLPPPTLHPGAPADFFSVDLSDPSLVGPAEDLVSTLVFSGQTRAIQDVMVAGRFIVRDGQHPEAAAITGRFRALTELL